MIIRVYSEFIIADNFPILSKRAGFPFRTVFPVVIYGEKPSIIGLISAYSGFSLAVFTAEDNIFLISSDSSMIAPSLFLGSNSESRTTLSQ
jgi:hypothetical protein